MFIYAGGRRTGKTSRMIEWFLGDPSNRIIIVPNAAQANYIVRRIKASMGAEFPFYSHIVPFDDARQLLAGSRNFQIGIENLDMILFNMFRNTAEFVTVTGVKIHSHRDKPWWRFW